MKGKKPWAGIQETYSLSKHLLEPRCGQGDVRDTKELLKTKETGIPTSNFITVAGTGWGMQPLFNKYVLNQINLAMNSQVSFPPQGSYATSYSKKGGKK